MHQLILTSAVALVTATFARAQTYVIAPDNAGLTQPSSSTVAWRDSTTGFRSQFVYDTTHFTNLGVTGPVVINRLRFRAANGSTSVGGNYPGNGTSTGVTLDIGTSLTDYTTPSLTFASNRGTMQNVLTWGTVTCAAGAGLTPNNYVIDIPIPGGFVYDPTLGLDLLIDITGSDFIGTIPSMSTGVSLAASRCNRISSTPSTAPTGTTSAGACPVVIFHIVGTGGIPDNGSGFPAFERGTAVPYGLDCQYESRARAELFPTAASTLDLGTGIRLVPDVPGGPTTYTFTANAASTFYPVGPTPLLDMGTATLGDDATSQACNLPFTFPFPGGSTTVVHANANGYVCLFGTTANAGDFSPTLAEMVSSTSTQNGPRLFACWYDFHPSRNVTLNAAAGLHFDVDTGNNKAYLTWNDVGEAATSAAGAKSFNIQVELSADGTIEIRYGAMTTFGSTIQPKIVGFSPGTSALVPLSQDLSASMPFSTSTTEKAPLLLSSANPATGNLTAPVIGNSMVLSTTNVPAPGVVLNWISAGQFNPGIDLGALGITGGCAAYVDLGALIQEALVFGTGTVPINIAVPYNPALVGVNAFSQSAAIDPTANAFGVIVSNGIALHVGNMP